MTQLEKYLLADAKERLLTDLFTCSEPLLQVPPGPFHVLRAAPPATGGGALARGDCQEEGQAVQGEQPQGGQDYQVDCQGET